ncbi:glycoside hydrolase family 3 N-terminal domain-containing protein [Hahella aquimaris]|uniref:glycoside hydrolase family 3 protein n=1 Tax=Hahella sp. HNIBRBA332 TaxID=3015983 RepID=UPI00273BDD69|nr:glycoside hydrolase family 3 protein [Hahella sp. HNIBRBA332]WLQ13336.1 glycoside hydrolase family 3 N-terminal domain-containing protein [Hahella sp. HNIBRBA332]
MYVSRRLKLKALSTMMIVAALTACSSDSNDNDGKDGPGAPDPVAGVDYINTFSDWPAIQSAIAKDPQIEARIAEIMATMSLEEKVGQMIQPELQHLTPEEVKQYHIGSVLNGGGSWPGTNKHATVQEWLDIADALWEASMDESDGNAAIPIIWGTDAVHGHSNVVGATLFPHNIGLGAARDADLIRRIGAATAKEVAVTGIDWTFAPTLAVVRDDRWGRTYEGYSEDGEIIFDYGAAMVEGLQGNFDQSHVVATAKHFIGDGGTDKGNDQGDNLADQNTLINLHGQGYYSALRAGAQTVMASFNSWQGEKLHGRKDLLTDVLKGKMGFDGLIVSDWNGIGQVDGCTESNCPQAVNAGIDLFMVPYKVDWKAFYQNTIDSVNAGAIEMSRIDDAVARILRVKLRAGLFEKPKPSQRALAGKVEVLGSNEHRELAREAVRKSLVLLKNKNGILPLSRDARILVVGKSADSLSNQSGGWTISWQGTGLNEAEDFPGATSILKGIQDVASNVTYDADGGDADPNLHDVAIVVIGETPYAEGVGDLEGAKTLEHARNYAQDLAVLETIRNAGVPVVTVFLSGRPLYVNKELNRSNAFVAAWLPGSEGEGVADVLFAKAEGGVNFDFVGKLSYSWPNSPCHTPLNKGDASDALFAYGFGLSYQDADSLGDDLSEASQAFGCDQSDPGDGGTTNVNLDLFTSGQNQGDWVMRIGGPSNWGGTPVSMDPAVTTALEGNEVSVSTEDGAIQFSAKRVKWTDVGQVYMQATEDNEGKDLTPYYNSKTSVKFRVKVNEAPAGDVNLSLHCVYPCLGEVAVGDFMRGLPVGEWTEVSIPFQCFVDDGLDFSNVNTPFLLYSGGAMDLSLENIRWEPNTAADTPDCSSFAQENIALTETTDVYTDGVTNTELFAQPGVWAVSSWDPYQEDASFVTLDAALADGAGTVVDAQYGAPAAEHAAKGVVLFKSAKPLNVSALSKLTFDVKVIDFAASTGLVAKVNCGADCGTGDIAILDSAAALNVWHPVEINFADYDGLNTAEVTSVLEILPVWDSEMRNVHFQVDNVRLVK